MNDANTKTLLVPADALRIVLQNARAHENEKRELQAQVDEAVRRVRVLSAKTAEVEQQLAQYRTNHRQSDLSFGSPHVSRSPPKRMAAVASGQGLGLTPPLSVATERVAQLEEVVASVRDISSQGNFDTVIMKILHAAKKLVRADKYTLGILNERRNVVEIFSTEPEQLADASDATSPVNEGFIAADSPTTFGRVLMTGKPLSIEDFFAHENYERQMEMTGITPHALLCLPIRNANQSVVGVLQVVSTARTISPAVVSKSGTKRLPLADYTPTRFQDTDKQMLEFLAVVAGAAIWNLILSRERQTAQNRIEGLLKLHRNLSMEAVSSAVLDQVLSVCHELLGTERIGLFMKMEGENELYITSAADIVRGEYVPIAKGIVGFVARTGETIITNDAYSHPMFDPTLDLKTGFVTKRILCLPVKAPDGTILAVLSAVNKVDGTDFSHEDAIFLNYAADTVGTSLYKASLLHEVKTAQKLIEARLQLTTFIAESTDIAEFAGLVMQLGKDIMQCDRFGLLLIDHFKKELWITPQIGGESIRSPMNRGLSGLVATTGKPVCTRDAYKHELFDPSVDLKTGYRTTSVLCMPIFEDHAASNRKVVAVAMCINKKEGSHIVAFTKFDRDTMTKFCSEVQFALGRLSLDISYYKVVSDCVADNATSAPQATGAPLSPRRMPSANHVDPFSETDIISSIVHKFCCVSAPDDLLATREPLSLAALVPIIKHEQHEDDVVPFPRDIVFAQGVNEPLDQWDTNTSVFSSSDIAMCCGIIFRAYGFLEYFRISGDKFATFASNVANYYRSNPFHNFQHAFQVMLTMHFMIRTECRKFFSGFEIFAMLIASLCHDIDHPGNTNDFELKTLSPMALTHNDDAVLERHHCRVTFIILNHKSAKILQYLDADRYRRMRQLIIACILATDMSKHFEKCKVLESLTRRQLSEKRAVLLGILVHAADLSHQALPFQQAFVWSHRMLDEFQNQAKAEADLGIPTDWFMQDLDSRRTRLTVQLHFINYIVRPIWLPLTSLCLHLRVCLHCSKLGGVFLGCLTNV